MNQNKTEIVFVLDKSGSMGGLVGDTIGGYNSFLNKQKLIEGEATVSTIFFNHNVEWIHRSVDIQKVEEITTNEYFVSGTTALLDAIGQGITQKGLDLARMNEADRPGQVLFVIITDGMENSSREFNYKRIREMIEHQKEKYSWEFIFLGANINAVETAWNFGINQDRVSDFHSDSKGTELNYAVVNEMVSNYRRERKINKNWNEKIQEDYEARK